MFWVAYWISPRFCHRFVGYLEEEAVRTYTHCLSVSLRLHSGSFCIAIYNIIIIYTNWGAVDHVFSCTCVCSFLLCTCTIVGN